MSVVADAPVIAAPAVEAPVIAGGAPFGAFPAGFGATAFPAGLTGLGGFSSFGGFPTTTAPVAAGFGGFGGFPASFGAQAFPANFGGFGGFGAPSIVAGGANAALALDAADGVIDGKFAGQPIVNAAPTFSTFGAPAAFGTQFGGYPANFGGFGAQAFPSSFGGFGAPAVVAGGANAALALDAADGVIDGKFAGQPIVNAGATSFGAYPGSFGGYPGFVGASAPVSYGQSPFVQEAYPAFAPTYAPSFAQTVSGAIAAPVAPARKVWQNGARRSLVTGHPTRF